MRNLNLKHFSRPRRREGEDVVQNNLSYTPTQMMQLVEQGIPVTTHNLSPDMFNDGLPPSQTSFDLPLDRTRGVDVADCWQASKNVRKKAKNGLKNDIQKFGKEPSPKTP